MYCDFFGLRCPPFDDIPDPRFFYASADHEEALALLRFAAANRKGPVLLTGPLGTGKTLLCRTLLSHLDIGAIPVLGTCSPGDPSGLIRRVCKALNLRLTRSAVPAEDAERLKKHILSRTSPRRSMVLLVLDQVENLTPADFEELSILSSLEVHSSRLLQIILVGHPRVAETLAAQQFEQLRQRMFAVHHLRPLRAEEVPLYVRHRLSEAGCSEEPLFDDDGLSLIAERSEGVPRLVNQLCDAAMLAAFSAGRRTIDRALVSEIILPSAAVSATAKAKAASAEAGADPAAPEQASQTTTRIEQVLSEGEALAGRLEKALLRAEPITTGANLDPASGGCEVAGRSTADRLFELLRDAPDALATAQSSTEAIEQRIEGACARAEGAACRLENAVAESARLSENITGQIGMIEEACDRARSVRAELSGPADGQGGTGEYTEQRLISLLEKLDATGGMDSLIERLDQAGKLAAEKAEEAIRDLTDRTPQAAREQIETLQATITESRRASEQLHGKIADGQTALEAIEHRLRAGVADGQSVAEALNGASNNAATSVKALQTETDAVQGRSGQIMSVIQAAKATGAGATLVVEEACRAVDHLAGTVSEAEKAVQAIEDRLQANLADGRSTIDTLNETATRAGDTIESLREEIGAVQDKSEQMASVTKASREATGQAESVIADAHVAADQLLGKIVEGGQAVQAIEERLHANLADGRSTIDTLSETAARAGETIDSLREEVSAAQDKSRQIASVTEASQEAARQAQSATSEAQRAAEQLRGKVADGDQAIQAIQERLRASLGDGHSTIEALNEAATWGVHTLDALRVEIGVAREKSEQMASLTEASGEATGQAQSVIADAHRAADQLLGKVADGDQAVEAIEQRLRAGITEGEDAGARLEGRLELRLAAGQAAAESLGETTARGSEAAKTLLVQIGVAEEKARQLGSVTSAAREASQQAASIVQEAHLAAGQLCDTRDGAEAAQQHLESACARAEQDAENLEALQAGATGTVARLDERLSSADSAAERIGRMIDEVWSLTSTTEDRARQLSAEAERVERLLGELRQSGGETKKLAERLATQTPQAAELLSKLGQRCRQVPGLVAQLAEYKKASVQATEQCKGQTEQADQAAAALVESVRSSTSLIDKLGQAAARATRTAEKLAERREAAHAALERQQMLHDRDQSLLEQLQVQTCQVEDLLQGLSACTADATRANDQLAENCQRAGQTIEQMAGQIEAVDAREQVLDAAQQTLSEFIGHAESINRQIRKLQGQADSFEVHVSRLLEKPEQIVSDAKAQSAQLQGVCRAVRKVFASLAQATLQANHRIEHFSRMGRTAEGRAHRLSAETARAAETLRTWVTEAVRAHSRLTESLERCPTASQTHPAESLAGLASVTRMQGLPGLDNMSEKTPFDLPATAEGLGRAAATQARSRTEEISQLIEEARRFAEGEAEMANSEY